MSYPLALIEFELLLLLVVLAFVHPALVSRVRGWCEGGRRWHCGAVAGLALGLHLLAWPVLRPAVPGWPEEFGNLLWGELLASGRATAPVHPLRAHFEAAGVRWEPGYGSALPPGDGLVLALGQLLGNPTVGVWLVTAVFCGAVYWMLGGWMPWSWALMGALLAALRWGVFSAWANTYAGGALAALAGCLVWGAVGRLRGQAAMGPSAALWVGLALVMVSRPVEGLGLGVAALVVVVLGKARPVQALAGGAAILALGTAVAGSMGWLAFSPGAKIGEKLGTAWLFLLGPGMTVAVVAYAVAMARGGVARGLPALGLLAVTCGVLVGSGPALAAWAPAAGCVVLVAMEGLRGLMAWRPQVAVACLLACAAVVPLRATVWLGWLELGDYPPGKAAPWDASELHPLRRRAGVMRELKKLGGKHVVLVRYGQGHPPFEEYVYNGADIDQTDVVWARELPNPLANLGLVQHYGRDRRVWLWRVDETDVVEPHPLAGLR